MLTPATLLLNGVMDLALCTCTTIEKFLQVAMPPASLLKTSVVAGYCNFAISRNRAEGTVTLHAVPAHYHIIDGKSESM